MSTVPSDVVQVERDGAVRTFTINHPPANAISRAVIARLGAALSEAEADPECRVLVLTGAGTRFFAAGADVTEFEDAGGEVIAEGHRLTLAFEASRLVLIAAINGIAFGGGCELALAADVRLASTAARFGQPEIKLGIIPGWGGTQRLPRLIGRTAAAELLLTGDAVDAERALELGLVNRVVEPDALLPAALELAGKLAAQAPLALAATKRALVDGLDRPLVDALDIERLRFIELFDTDDAAEGVAAFLEKREPDWKGR